MQITNDQRMNLLIAKIFEQSKTEIYLNSRFFIMAFQFLKMVGTTKPEYIRDSIGFDGENIHFFPLWVIKTYSENKRLFCRTLIHMVLHGIYRHNYKSVMYGSNNAWNLACDIAVESIIDELDLSYTKIEGVSERNKIYDELRSNVRILTAEYLYSFIVNMDRAKQTQFSEIFSKDCHDIWYQPIPIDDTSGDGKENDELENNNQNTLTSNQSYEQNDNNQDRSDSSSQNQTRRKSNIGHNKQSSMRDMGNYWDEIGKEMMLGLETFHSLIGREAGHFMRTLKIEHRRRYDYKKFLTTYMVEKEVMKEDLDQFDYIYYAYGLTLYKNMPLIDFLEYKETFVIQDLVIVIDTSGSTYDALARRFIEETYDIIMTSNDKYNQYNVHIIQSDTVIQNHIVIRNKESFEKYMNKFSLHGGGGTDFRFAFKYIDELIEKKAFTKLKGVLYFTDGMGVYPKSKPDYDVVFVFIDNEYDDRDVPKWAIKLILGEEELS
jgi:predicted metal-dependent peptidase